MKRYSPTGNFIRCENVSLVALHFVVHIMHPVLYQESPRQLSHSTHLKAVEDCCRHYQPLSRHRECFLEVHYPLEFQETVATSSQNL